MVSSGSFDAVLPQNRGAAKAPISGLAIVTGFIWAGNGLNFSPQIISMVMEKHHSFLS